MTVGLGDQGLDQGIGHEIGVGSGDRGPDREIEHWIGAGSEDQGWIRASKVGP